MFEVNDVASEFSLHDLLSPMDEVFFIFQPQDNKLLFLNPAFQKVFNLSIESIFSDVLHPDDVAYAGNVFAELKKDKQKQNIELRIQLSDGTIKWLRIKAFLSQKDNIDIITGTATDITADKEYYSVLQKYSDKKNSILQILSHDLIAPLGNIGALTSLLSEHFTDNQDETVTQFLDLINQSSSRGVTLIRDLVNKEFLQSMQAPLIKQRVDLIKKIEEVIDQFNLSPRIRQHQRIHFMASVRSLFVTIDTLKFMQAITNLLSNELKFTPEDGDITITVENEGNTVLIKVQDSGIGIPEEMQPFLFDKFTQAGRTGINGEASTGLGMSIIKTVVQWHNGEIWFESIEAKGSTFYIRIAKNG